MKTEKLVTKLRAIRAAQQAVPDPDVEVQHERADMLLLKYINDPEVTAAYKSIGRWYA